VRYTNRFGEPVLHDAWSARVPAPVAEADQARACPRRGHWMRRERR
jgi:hypothetical protein